MLEKLLEYQETDEKLKKIENEINQSEERKKAVSASNYLKTVNDAVAAINAKAAVLAEKFTALEKMIGELNEQMKEYDDITCETSDELAYVKKKSAELSDKIASVSSETEAVAAEITAAIKEYSSIVARSKEAKAQYVEYRPKYEELKKSREGEINEIKTRLSEIEKGLPKEFIEKYAAKRRDKISPVLSEARIVSKNAYCRCGTGVPAAAYNYLKSGEIIECETCHRLLYLK